MFPFFKKEKSERDREEKERHKREKKERKALAAAGGAIGIGKSSSSYDVSKPLTQEELNRLEEVRRSFRGSSSEGDSIRKKLRKEKLPSGITADYRDSNIENERSSSGGHIVQRPVQLPPPRPPSRGILKGQNSNSVVRSVSGDLDDMNVLLKNTAANEYVSPSVAAKAAAAAASPSTPSPTKTLSPGDCSADREVCYENVPPPVRVRASLGHVATPTKSEDLPALLTGERLGLNQRPLSSNFTVPDSTDSASADSGNDADLERELEFRRSSPTFGLTLRRATSQRAGSWRRKSSSSSVAATDVIVVEAASTSEGRGLLPGDQLLEVNGVSVAGKSRDEVNDLIRSFDGDVLRVKVRPLCELAEVSRRIQRSTHSRHSAGDAARFKIRKAKSEEQLESEKAFLEAERVWLVHKDGFVAAGLLKRSDSDSAQEGKVRVQLDYNGDIIEVEEDDVERANPPGFDKIENLAQLRYLNESSVLHTLRQRYSNNLINTFAGPTIIAINPMVPLGIYSDKVAQMFRECRIEDMPPHIFSVAASAHRDMLQSRKDQSVVFIGRSGSGKTTNVRHVLNYYTNGMRGQQKAFTAEKVDAIFTLLEAFGNARTVMNANATRFSMLFSVDFDTAGTITSGAIQTMLLDKYRVVRRPDGEPTFNIFYQMLAGIDSKTRRELHLENLNEANLFMTPLSRAEDKARASSAWTAICACASSLDMAPSESLSLWSVLAAIYHLGVASVTRGGMAKTQFAKPQAAQRAAHCLGTSVEELTRTIFQGNSSSSTLNRKLRSAERDSANLPDGIEALEAFVVGLYQEVFNALIFLINRSISSTANGHNSIWVLDAPGFQNPATCGRLHPGASFEDLCHNYAQERLQLLFHERTITSLQERYVQEQLDVDGEAAADVATPQPLVSLLDKQAGVRVSQHDLASADRKGLLWLLDEEALFPGATDESFVVRLMQQHAGHRGAEDLLKKGPSEKQFVLQHFQGTNPVLYSTVGWLQASREDAAVKAASMHLQESNNKEMSDLFCACRGPGLSSVSGSVAGLENAHLLRRASSMRRAFTTGGQAAIKRNSIPLQVKFQVDGLVEQLRRTRAHFVHCFLPQHSAGLCDVKASKTEDNNGAVVNVPLLRSQLRGGQILDAVRLHKNGFPDHLGFGEFWRRFRILSEAAAAKTQQPALSEMRAAVEDLVESIEVDKTTLRLGTSQIFLRSGVLAHLNEEREERLTDQVVRLQAICRGHLARRRLQRLKTHDIAIRCIQRNVRKFMGVRDWPWWRMLVKLTPLLNVHRTEDQLKATAEEVESLRAKLDKAEKERNELKQNNERLEARLGEVSADLAEEHSTATLASERLETEQSDRLRLEKERSDLLDRNKQLQTANERMEMELLYSRAIDMNGAADSDEDAEPSIYKQKYERAMKELEVTKKRLQQQHEDDMEQLLALKKQLEKKVNDAYEEVDEQRQMVAQWKRKTQKAQGEMNDMKLLIEEHVSRNTLLEKKQRKFDAEIASLQEEKRQESVSKEKLHREIDELKRQRFQLDDQLQSSKMDLEMKEEKLAALMKEMDDLHGVAGTDDELATLKKLKHDLELKVKDQEEELDDLAGQVQMLEQAKTKLEMLNATQKKDYRRELSSKDEELEDSRTSSQKKVKMLEQQLEVEHEERIHLVREKHDLEARLMNLQEIAARSSDEELVIKLKKDLKRTKALLKDAQLMIERSRSESSNKVVLRQLKNQLEDAEFGRTAAIKARQNMEIELTEVQQQLDDIIRAKSDLEDKMLRISREKSDMSTQLEDHEEELQEVMRKYKASVAQLSVDQITIQEQSHQISDLEEERSKLKEQIAEYSQKIAFLEGDTTLSAQQNRLELKIREMESKLELEQTTRGRMESQIGRLKECIERLNVDCDSLRLKEQSAQDLVRKLQRQLRDMKEDFVTLQQKETDTNSKKNELEKALELAEADTVTCRNDLKLALKRIEDLQTAINGELDSDESESINSDVDSDSSEDGVTSLLEKHRRARQANDGHEHQLSDSSDDEDAARRPPSPARRHSQQLRSLDDVDESQA